MHPPPPHTILAACHSGLQTPPRQPPTACPTVGGFSCANHSRKVESDVIAVRMERSESTQHFSNVFFVERRIMHATSIKAFHIISFLLVITGSPSHAAIIAKWDFDQGDLTDSSGNGHHLMHFNQFYPLSYGQGRNGLAPIFTNADYLYSRAPELHANRAEFTVGGWIRSSQTQNRDSILFMNGDDHTGFIRFYGGATLHYDTIYGYVRSGPNNVNSSGTGITVNDGNWHHIALVKAATTELNLRLYFDGELINERTSEYGSTGLGNIFTIGGKAYGDRTATGLGFTGLIDEVFVADHAMTINEIRDIAGITAVPEPSLFGFLLMAGGLFTCFRRRSISPHNV